MFRTLSQNRAIRMSLAVACGLALGACSASTTDNATVASTAVTLSGVLGTTSSAQSLNKMSMKSDVSALDLASYSVKCATTTTPPLEGTGTVDASGNFSVSIDGAAGLPMSCYLVNAAGTKAADFLISDSSKTDMNGNPQVTSSAAFEGTAALGSITFDPDSGEVTIPATAVASNIKTINASATSVFDPTGNWTIGSVDFTLPTGVGGPCDESSNDCEGPPAGAAIYLKMFSGTRTADSSPVHGLQVWQGDSTTTGEGAYAACGSKIGLSASDASGIGVDFSNNAENGAFSFASSVSNFTDQFDSLSSGTVTLTDNWKMDTAKTQWAQTEGCSNESVTIAGTTYLGYKCGPDNNQYYQMGLSGGCTNAAGTPVQPTDWSGINSCTQSTIDSNGIRSSTCSGTATINNASVAVTCTNSWLITNAAGTVDMDNSHYFNHSHLTQIASGTACSALSTELARVRCYADYYWQSGMARNPAVCTPRIDTDWSATTAANFVKVDFRPNAMVFMDEYRPTPDGLGGGILTRQEHWRGVQVGTNDWVNCKVIETGALSVRRINDNKLLATYQSSTITSSRSKPACTAAYTGARESFMFYLSK